MRVSLRGWVPGVLAGVLVLAISSLALGQDKDPANGTWKLNVAKSKFSPGPAPKEMTATIESAGAGRHVEVTGVTGEGAQLKWGYSGNYDGKDIRVTGSNPDADVVMLRRLTPTTVRSTYKKDGKRTLVNGVSVSDDGKTLTVAQSGVNGKGETVKNSLVFDRQ